MFRENVRLYSRLFLLIYFAVCMVPLSSLAQSNREAKAESDVEAARQAQKEGDYAEAVAEYRAALKLMPGNAELQSNLGIAYFLRGEYSYAINCFHEALRQKPDLLASNLFLGLACIRTSQYERSIHPLERAIELNPKLSHAYVDLAGSYDEIGNEDKAVEVLGRAEKLFPDNVDVLYNLGTLYYRLMVKTYEKMAQVAPNSSRYDQVLGKSFEMQHQIPAALYEYEQAIKKNPTGSGLHYALGNLYWFEGQYTEAKQEFKAELQLYPENYQATWKLGDIYFKEGQFGKATYYLMRAIHQKADLWQAYQDLGRLNLRVNKLQRSLLYIKKAVQLAPNQPNNHYLLAQVDRKLGNRAGARAEINDFVKLKAIEKERQTPSSKLVQAASGNQAVGSPPDKVPAGH